MKSLLVRLGLAALLAGALAGCGGSGSNGAPGASGTNGSNGLSGTVAQGNAQTMTATQWQALKPTINVASVTINPASAGGTVVKFSVVDQSNNPVTGLSCQTLSATASQNLPSNCDFGFTLAKLIPPAKGEPSRWVNYLVTKPATLAPATSGLTPAVSSVPATASTGASIQWVAAYPTAETQGTLVETIGGVPQAKGVVGDGGYQYTFLRDITQAQAIVNAIGNSGYEGSPSGKTNGAGVAGVYHVADLDPANLNYDPTATHRLGIYFSGSQPGTGTATPTAVAVATAPAVPLVMTANVGYDFVPNGSKPAVTRNIVQATACDGCHDNVQFKRGLGHITYNLSGYNQTAAATASTGGYPAGAIMGRNDPRLCVTCHTDQAKFGFPDVAAITNADGSPAYGPEPASTNNPYYREITARVPVTQQASYIFPRLVHKTHMGNQLVYTGYNENQNCKNGGGTLANNVGQCFNQIGFSQDQRDCMKCHDGSADTGSYGNGTKTPNGTSDSANWKNYPNIAACGSCHDGINFATGTGIALIDRDKDVAAGKPVGTTATGHGGGVQTSNANCSTCHTSTDIVAAHTTYYSTPNNPTAAAYQSQTVSYGMPTISYNIKSGGVTVDSKGHVNYTFQILVNGTPLTSLPVIPPVTRGDTGAAALNTNAVMYTGTTGTTAFSLQNGGPSLFVEYSIPQDGITSPADFNFPDASVSLAALLIDTTQGTAPTSPAAGYLTNTVSNGAFQAASGGYFTAVLTGDTIGQPAGVGCVKPTAPTVANCVNTAILASPLVVPSTATNVTGMIRGGFTVSTPALPFVAGNLAVNPVISAGSNGGIDKPATATTTSGGGIHITGLIVMQAASSGTGSCTAIPNTAGSSCRRAVTSKALCNNCHEQLGTGWVNSTNQDLFHTGDSNDPNACSVCHTVNQVDGTGFAANISTWVHGIHGGQQRSVAFTANANMSALQYPGLLRDCSQCHLPNTVNFGTTSFNGGGSVLPNLLWTYEAKGVIANTYNQPVIVNQQTPVNTTVNSVSPYVTVGTNYGNVFSFKGQGATLSTYTAVLGNNNAGGLGAAAGAVVPTQVAPVGGLTVPADNATLVTSPITAACTACHTDSTAINHVQANGGKFYVTRGSVDNGKGGLVNTEACLACHGQGTGQYDAAVVHSSTY